MGRAPCCDKNNVKRGPWSPEEDAKLKSFIDKHGTGGNWIALPQKAGLKRCGKSCRLRWLNYLRPNIKHGEFTDDEDRIICSLYANIGSRWSIIAAQLPGRTDNDIKNYWNTKLKKKLLAMLPPFQRKPSFFPSLPLQSPNIYNNSTPFFNYNTNPNFINLNNNINSLLSQDHFNIANLSIPQQDSNSLISLLTNNNIANNENNNSFYLGFQDNNDQNMHPTSDVKESMLMFGNHEVSTTGSSSENGSCLSQISYENYNKDHHQLHHQIKQEDKFFLQGFGDQSQSFIMNNNLKNYENLLHSELEEVKQLIIGNENDDEYKTTHYHY